MLNSPPVDKKSEAWNCDRNLKISPIGYEIRESGCEDVTGSEK